ncbi:hypothetical protein ACFOET_09110 [Parapedobacter deserti]|uniref:Uncharacterized protein n=1 Tax=Parapedobacter deserti TaxID=1912957 RepID=A0ABV7JLL7_9SPHI
MKGKDITTAQDKSRNKEMGNPTADKAFTDTKKQKRAQGLPNAGGVRNRQIKKDK